MESLNLHQRKAVEAKGHCLVTACPGSGKTRVLAYRSAHLLTRNPTGKLLAVTFTRDAATSLKERILTQAGASARSRIAVGTLHSLAITQLKRAGLFKRIASPAEQSLLMRRAGEHTHEPIPYEDTVQAIEQIKSTMESPPPEHESTGAEAYHLYQGYMDQAGLHDFYDLLLLAVLSMRDGSAKPFSPNWLLVDEAQDMDEVQMAWVREHTQSGAETMLVADDDQSIYGWRHAMGYKGLIQFREQLKADLVTLPVNYRCDQTIIQAAAKLIMCNKERVAKKVEGVATDPGRVSVLSFDDRILEAEAIVEEAAKDPREFAVLARTNQLLDAVELKLSAHGIAYYRTGGRSLWEREAPGTVLGLLNAVTEQKHGGIITALHYTKVPVTTIDALLPTNTRNPYRKLLNGMEDPPARTSKKESMERVGLIKLARLCRQWEALLSQNRSALVINGIAVWVRSHLQPTHPEHDICTWLSETLMRMDGPLSKRLALLQRPRKNDREGIALMTLHSSKGLEWDRVWIVGVEQDVLPHEDSPLEEERRLCYVGMTRARHELFLSWKKGVGSSQFLEEAGVIDAEQQQGAEHAAVG